MKLLIFLFIVPCISYADVWVNPTFVERQLYRAASTKCGYQISNHDKERKRIIAANDIVKKNCIDSKMSESAAERTLELNTRRLRKESIKNAMLFLKSYDCNTLTEFLKNVCKTYK